MWGQQEKQLDHGNKRLHILKIYNIDQQINKQNEEFEWTIEDKSIPNWWSTSKKTSIIGENTTGTLQRSLTKDSHQAN